MTVQYVKNTSRVLICCIRGDAKEKNLKELERYFWGSLVQGFTRTFFFKNFIALIQAKLFSPFFRPTRHCVFL